jgi:hypothetical protein
VGGRSPGKSIPRPASNRSAGSCTRPNASRASRRPGGSWSTTRCAG